MSLPRIDDIAEGDELPPLKHPLVDRSRLALYAGASGDHNPIHIDIDFARNAGMDDVFAHGMLGMAWMARRLTTWVPQPQIRSLEARFVGITELGETITTRARVTAKREVGGEKQVELALENVGSDGEARIVGTALVALP